VRDYRLAALATLLASIAGLVLQVASPDKGLVIIGFTLQVAAVLFAFFISIATRNIEPRPPAYTGNRAALVFVTVFQILVAVSIFGALFTGRGHSPGQWLLQLGAVLLLLFSRFNEGKLHGPVARDSKPPVSGAP
jgi:hypothetical protein